MDAKMEILARCPNVSFGVYRAGRTDVDDAPPGSSK